MFDLLKILIFGKWIVLTPSPITIESTPLTVPPFKNLDVLTSGANVRVDVSGEFPRPRSIKYLEAVKAKYPIGCVKVSVDAEKQGERTLANQLVSFGQDSIHLVFSANSGLEPDLHITAVSVSSCRRIQNATVIWANYSQ